MSNPNKQKAESLWRAGGCATLANKLCGDYTVDEYEEYYETDEYRVYRTEIDNRFKFNLDSLLISELYHTLEHLKNAKDDPKAIKALSEHLDKLLKHTQPIIERHKELNPYEIPNNGKIRFDD